jgi:ComF family protein
LSIFNKKNLNNSLILRHLLPDQPCVLCGDMSRDIWCDACDAAMPYLNAPHCPVCALPTPQGELCGHCLKNPPAFSRTLAVFGYRFPADHLIQLMKYREQLALSRAFAEKFVHRLDRSNLPDCLIAMPLHPSKLQSRGFNQAQLIAAPIANLLDIPLLSLACRRLRDTPSQTSLPWKARSKNMRGAFACEMDFSGKHVALVDDVLTTGASMNALAEAVQQRGAGAISAWVIARTAA